MMGIFVYYRYINAFLKKGEVFMRILICDDEPTIVRQISEIIANAYPDIELVGVHSSAELSERLASENADRNFDLAFLDIAVSDESGVDIAEFINALCPGVKIVFVSGNQDLVSKAFVTVDDCGYIYKPVDPMILRGYIERERAGSRRKTEEYFEYLSRGTAHRIGSDSILFISSERNHLEIHTASGKNVTVSGKLDEAEKQLESGFVRCHKSYLVNLKYIAKYTATQFYLMNGDTVPISRSKKKESADKYVLFKGASAK